MASRDVIEMVVDKPEQKNEARRVRRGPSKAQALVSVAGHQRTLTQRAQAPGAAGMHPLRLGTNVPVR